MDSDQKTTSKKEQAKELARQRRREEYERQKEYQRKRRQEAKAQKAEDKREARQKKDDALWKLIKPADDVEGDG